MELKKLAPWNWFRPEEEQPGRTELTNMGDRFGIVSHRFPNSFDNMLNYFFSDAMPERHGDKSKTTTLSTFDYLKPKVDLKAEDKEYVLTIEIPGVSEKDVKVDVVDNTMTIRGEKKQEKETKEEKYYRMERSYGSFQRVIALPEDVDQDNIAANFKNGVLTISMPRHDVIDQKAKPITITSS